MRVRDKVGGGVWITGVTPDTPHLRRELLDVSPTDEQEAFNALTADLDYLLVVETEEEGFRVRCYPQHGYAASRGYGVQLSYVGSSILNILQHAWVDANLIAARKCSYRVTPRETPVHVP